MTRARREDGWALVTALTLMLVMAVFAMGTMSLVDNEQHQSAVGRQRETAFNVAEAALNAQMFQLSRSWAGKNPNLAYPDRCTQASTAPQCPSAATLISLYNSPDTMPTATWTTYVRDNLDPSNPRCDNSPGDQSYWSDSLIAAAPSRDCNDDGRLWVRSTSTVFGRTRSMVALVRTEPRTEKLPQATLISGKLAIGNNGNKAIIDTIGGGASASTGPVRVRCDPQASPTVTCLGHQLTNGGLLSNLTNLLASLTDLLNIQIKPNVATFNYGDEDALAPDQVERLKQTAISDGTYYTTCPTDLTGDVVFIDTTLTCSYRSNDVYNSPSDPGLIIMTGGTLVLEGTLRYYGVVYHENASNSTGTAVQIQGSARVQGGVLIDGDATLAVGNSGGANINLAFDINAFTKVQSRGGAGIVQNTWRELR